MTPTSFPRAAPRMLTVQITAERLQLSTKTVRRMIARKELIAHRLGRVLRIAEDDLNRFLTQRRY